MVKEKTADQLSKENQELIAENEALKQQVADQQSIIEQLRAGVSAEQTIDLVHNKQKYTAPANIKFKHKGRSYKATDLETNKELLAELVELGAGFLSPAE